MPPVRRRTAAGNSADELPAATIARSIAAWRCFSAVACAAFVSACASTSCRGSAQPFGGSTFRGSIFSAVWAAALFFGGSTLGSAFCSTISASRLGRRLHWWRLHHWRRLARHSRPGWRQPAPELDRDGAGRLVFQRTTNAMAMKSKPCAEQRQCERGPGPLRRMPATHARCASAASLHLHRQADARDARLLQLSSSRARRSRSGPDRRPR